MMTYNVKYMTKENYNRMISGHKDYVVESAIIKANNPHEAAEVVQTKYPDYIVGYTPDIIINEVIKTAKCETTK